jgi:hypothetical protein
MEQVGNARLFNEGYITKLKRATAVWDWSRENVHNINKFLSDTQLSMVPLWLAMAPAVQEYEKCIADGNPVQHVVPKQTLCPKVYTHRYNQMLPCQIDECSTSPPRNVQRECPATDVPFALFFGFMSPQRIRVCKLLSAKLPHRNIYCIDDAFGEVLLKYKCAAEVIFIMHNFHKASLEVHRVNPLLAMGKKVVSMASNDPALDYLYHKSAGVRFADTFSELAVQVDKAMDQAADEKALHFIRNQNIDVTPICSAIRSLDSQVALHKQAKWPEDTAFDTRKLNSRRRRTKTRRTARRRGARGVVL